MVNQQDDSIIFCTQLEFFQPQQHFYALHLSVISGERWIGRRGPVAWPPRSPDLTPLEYLFVKNLVYRGGPVNTSNELKTRIENSFEIVKSDTNTLRRVQAHIKKRANKCV